MEDLYERPFLVNIEGPDDIEEFDTMREAVERANEINAELVDTVSRGGEHAPHVWAVPWRTSTYLAQFRDVESRQIGSVLALGLPGTDLYDRIKEQADVGGDETLGKWAYRSRLMLIAEMLTGVHNPEKSGVPVQRPDEFDNDYVERVKAERPDLTLSDIGFVDAAETAPEAREVTDAESKARKTLDDLREWIKENRPINCGMFNDGSDDDATALLEIIRRADA